MADSGSKKSLRAFQCRDYLWELFEQLSRDLECTPDYLINEAMRYYARAQGKISVPGHEMKNAATATGTGESQLPPAGLPPSALPPPMGGAPSRTPGGGTPKAGVAAPSLPNKEFIQTMQLATPPQALDSSRYQHIRPPAEGFAPPPVVNPNLAGAQAPTPGFPSLGGAASPSRLPPPDFANQPREPSQLPPPLDSSGRPGLPAQHPPLAGGGVGRPPAAAPAAARQLVVEFQGERFPVNKAEFIIGRVSRTADLTIRDRNVSRRHAAVVFDGGRYYMKDLGSTNGVQFQGKRVEVKEIQDGDVFKICNYDLHFTFS